MQREVVDGIPYWTDKKNLYYYDVNPAAPKTLLLGTKTADGWKLIDEWEQQLVGPLNQFRADLVSRSRKPAAKT
jgi:hypothetical protein